MSDAPTLSHMHPAELHGSPINPRTITDERFEALKYSLEHDPEMMDARPVIVTTGAEVVAGNMRLRASVEMLADPDEYPNFNAFVKRRGGLPTFIADLTETRKREWMLRDNQEYGDWEADALATVIREYDTSTATRVAAASRTRRARRPPTCGASSSRAPMSRARASSWRN
jgi:hypothetical protein